MTVSNIRRATGSDIKELEFLLTKLVYQITTEALTVQFQHYDQPASTVLVSECAATNKIVGLISGYVIH